MPATAVDGCIFANGVRVPEACECRITDPALCFRRSLPPRHACQPATRELDDRVQPAHCHGGLGVVQRACLAPWASCTPSPVRFNGVGILATVVPALLGGIWWPRPLVCHAIPAEIQTATQSTSTVIQRAVLMPGSSSTSCSATCASTTASGHRCARMLQPATRTDTCPQKPKGRGRGGRRPIAEINMVPSST